MNHEIANRLHDISTDFFLAVFLTRKSRKERFDRFAALERFDDKKLARSYFTEIRCLQSPNFLETTGQPFKNKVF